MIFMKSRRKITEVNMAGFLRNDILNGLSPQSSDKAGADKFVFRTGNGNAGIVAIRPSQKAA